MCHLSYVNHTSMNLFMWPLGCSSLECWKLSSGEGAGKEGPAAYQGAVARPGGLRGPHSLLTQDLLAQSWTWAGALQAWLTDWPTEASQVHSSSGSLFARLKIVTKQINLISDFYWRFFFCFVVERRTHYLMFFLPDPFISMPLFYLKFLLPFFSHSISYVACYLSSVIFTARSSELFSKNNIW